MAIPVISMNFTMKRHKSHEAEKCIKMSFFKTAVGVLPTYMSMKASFQFGKFGFLCFLGGLFIFKQGNYGAEEMTKLLRVCIALAK